MREESTRILVALLTSISGIILTIRYLRLHPFFALIGASLLFGVIVRMGIVDSLNIIQLGFGNMMQRIGIIVVLGCVLGMLLEKTGIMEALSVGILNLFGRRRALFAMVFIGILVGIPVFCDSGFIILSRLIPTLAAKTSVSSTSLALGLSGGLYTTHTLVPPTPGPLAAATNLGLSDSIGWVIVTGILIAMPVLLVTYMYARHKGVAQSISMEMDAMTKPSLPLWKASAPIVVPVVLIALASFVQLSESSHLSDLLKIVGTPIVALTIGIALATLLTFRTKANWSEWITEALKDAGIILLITGAGGAFGVVIEHSGIENEVRAMTSSLEVTHIMLLAVAWLLAAILKTAQGSTTSSMIITSSMVFPMARALSLSVVDLALLTSAIGGGAMAVSHANDSYFWVISKFGGVTTTDMFKYFTPLTLLQGVTVLMATILASLLL